MVPFLSFYSIRREDRYKRETKYSLHSMGNIFLDLRRRDWWVLTPSPHTHKYYYAHYSLPRTSMYLPLSHVHVHISAHHIYTLWTLCCTLAPYTLHLFLFLFYKFTMCMCNVAHPVFTRSARFSHHGRKSSRHHSKRIPHYYVPNLKLIYYVLGFTKHATFHIHTCQPMHRGEYRSPPENPPSEPSHVFFGPCRLLPVVHFFLISCLIYWCKNYFKNFFLNQNVHLVKVH